MGDALSSFAVRLREFGQIAEFVIKAPKVNADKPLPTIR
jgi:hypothetical protein